MAGTGVIDDYVTGLDRALRGPRSLRLDMLAEARDSLLDAAEAMEDAGLEREAAEQAAVEEFGPIREIAPDYQERLSVVAGRRLAAMLFIGVPLTTIMWSVIWAVFPTTESVHESAPGWFVPVARAVDVLQLFIGLVGGVALLALGRGLRRIGRPRPVIRFLALFVWGVFPVIVVMCGALMLGSRGPQGPFGFGDYPPGQVASLVSYVAWIAQLYGALRCLSTTRHVPAGPVPAVACRA
ncbi:permease prefix domain 1-containing protein [Streptosporangium sp. NPDC050855]|uniref:permease prefix domain 1-containing protein n=1 Tax=Streptosporangium sp. NPDC050855 TaxID=3366194 RepID=UPI00379E50EC